MSDSRERLEYGLSGVGSCVLAVMTLCGFVLIFLVLRSLDSAPVRHDPGSPLNQSARHYAWMRGLPRQLDGSGDKPRIGPAAGPA